MAENLTISIDAMGGDHGPAVTLAGAAIAADRRPGLNFLFYGDKAAIDAVLADHPALASRSEVIHCEISISMDDKPSQALRRGRWKSGMWRAVQAVRDQESDVCISAGNTGALMAMAKFCLRTMEGIERPAMAALWPTVRGQSIVLDVGANVSADAGQLIDFAVMGSAMARAVLSKPQPTVGLLNIGVEEIKGQEEVREAGQILKESGLTNLAYHGFVEGDDLGRGTVDVVVTEGFAGNIALKTAEGTARQIGEYLRNAMSSGWLNKLGYLLARAAFKDIAEKMDPRKVNGAVFLGLNGLVIKSHGGTDAEGFAAAIDLGHQMAADRIMARIRDDLTSMGDRVPEEADD